MSAKRIVLIIHSLGGGGAEMTVARMANAWHDQQFDVTVITLSTAASDRYRLAKGVKRVALDLMHPSGGLGSALLGNGRRIAGLRHAIAAAKPDAVIGFTPSINVLAVLATRRMPLRLILAERSHPVVHNIGRSWDFLRRRTYRYSSAVVAQTHAAREHLLPLCGTTPVHVIANCVWPSTTGVVPCPPIAERPKRIVSVGRLDPNKGFDRLIDAFSKIAGDHPQWNLQIIGHGPEEDRLRQQIDALGLQQRVALLGWMDDPRPTVSQCQVFALASRYEGFPNALLEAMALGTVPASFDCQYGPAEIIRHETDGLLVPNGSIDLLALAIKRLLDDDTLRQQLSQQAIQVTRRFGCDEYFRRWNALLDSPSSQS